MAPVCSFKHCRRNSKAVKLFAVPGCRQKNNSLNLKLQRLQTERRNAWLRALKLDDSFELQQKKSMNMKICSLHFHSGKPAELEDCDNIDWAPTLNICEGSEEMGECLSNSMPALINEYHCGNNIQEIQEHILPDPDEVENFIINRSLSTQTEELSEESLNETVEIVSSSSTVLEVDSGNVHHSVAVQTEMDCLNEIRRLFAINRDLKKQAEHDAKRYDAKRIEADAKQIIGLKVKNIKLSQKLAESNKVNDELLLKEAAFLNDEKNQKIKHFTGLPNLSVFKVILRHLRTGLDQIRTAKNLDNFQKLILTFIKLRLNLTFRALGYRFLISPEQAQDIFYSVVVMINHSFNDFVHWPSKECMKLNMPKCFQDVYQDRVAVIIDCFEIGTERPNALKGRNQLFSQYKQKYTIKYLIGITPHGVISFISKGYAGRTSDNSVTQDCGILEKLVAGDVVLADRGFTISELVSEHQAELKTPAFKKNPQLHPLEVETTRALASVRVHVERLIGQIRNKYKILNGPIPISMLKTHFENKSIIDEIVRVACILVNLCDCVVPMD